MAKEVETAGKIANSEASGGSQGFKEAVYNTLGDVFGWLSNHQSLAIVIILIILGIIIWLIVRAKKYRRQFENEVYIKKKELDKKEALIREQEKKLADLQKKLSDLQGAVREAMLETIRTITGYDAEQLPAFFKSLTQITENPLQMADPRAITPPESQGLEGESDDSSGIIDLKEEVVSDSGFSEKNDAVEEKSASDDDPDKAAESKEAGER